MVHIAAITQLRLDTDGRDYYRRKRAEGKKPLEAIRCLKPRIPDAIYRDATPGTAQSEAPAQIDRLTTEGGRCDAVVVVASSWLAIVREGSLLESHAHSPWEVPRSGESISFVDNC